MEKVEFYRTKDGRIFEDPKHALLYEECKSEINTFIESEACHYNNKAHRKVVENTILAWSFWKADKGASQ